MRPIGIAYGDGFLTYNFGRSHALQEVRAKLAYELLRAYEVFDGAAALVDPAPASEAEVLRVHDPRYVDAVRELSARPRPEAYEWGLGPGDNPIFPGMYGATLLQVGATEQVCRLVGSGERTRAYTLGGGFHHAMRDRASGFCIFNDIAVGIAGLLEAGVGKVLYVDIDAHHGDGVQAMFYEDPRVLTISFHESGKFLFPGTGFPDEIGAGKGRGYSVNVPLPPYTGDASYGYAFEEIVPPLARAFRPDLIFTQTGGDAYHLDPLAHLKLTTRTYERVASTVDALSREVCGGGWVAATGGGYDLLACARIWTLIAAGMAGLDLPDPLPESWRDIAKREVGSAPGFLRDGDDRGERKVAASVREIVSEVKGNVFPHHGL